MGESWYAQCIYVCIWRMTYSYDVYVILYWSMTYLNEPSVLFFLNASAPRIEKCLMFLGEENNRSPWQHSAVRGRLNTVARCLWWRRRVRREPQWFGSCDRSYYYGSLFIWHRHWWMSDDKYSEYCTYKYEFCGLTARSYRSYRSYLKQYENIASWSSTLTDTTVYLVDVFSCSQCWQLKHGCRVDKQHDKSPEIDMDTVYSASELVKRQNILRRDEYKYLVLYHRKGRASHLIGVYGS
jgi:hypothetical protein